MTVTPYWLQMLMGFLFLLITASWALVTGSLVLAATLVAVPMALQECGWRGFTER